MNTLSPVAATGLVVALAFAGPSAAAAALVSIPVLPAYGQSVAVELEDASWPMYLPATRYTRAGFVIDIEYDYLTDGFGPVRPDFGQVPLSLGELPPGNYQVRARLKDIEKPAAAPIELAMQIAVVPPQEFGIYMLPREPQAFSATEAIIRSAAYFDPASMRVRVAGNIVRVDFDYLSDAPAGGAAPPGMKTYGSVSMPNLAPGTYRVEGWGRAAKSQPYEPFFARPFVVASTVPVIEYYGAPVDHYFMAAGADEIALLDRGAQGDWKRTGQKFTAWLRQSDAPAGASPICRFHARAPNSHFYTGSQQECEYLKADEPKQRAEAAARGEPFLGWEYEAIAFWAFIPVEGKCPSGMRPVYRAYNDRAAQKDPNHRFMADTGQRDAMSVGWIDEGAHLCGAS